MSFLFGLHSFLHNTLHSTSEPFNFKQINTAENAKSILLANTEHTYSLVVCASQWVSPQAVETAFFSEKVKAVFRKSIQNLLKIRNHLLLQLDLECGNISEEYFDQEEPKYLSEIENTPLEELREEIKLLLEFVGLPLTLDDVSEILNCSLGDAEKAKV